MAAHKLGETGIDLLNRSFAVSTLDKYQSMWTMFMEFSLDLDMEFGEMAICKFVEHLFLNGIKANSIMTYLAAIAHGLKVRKLEDHTKSYLVFCMIRGAKHIRPMGDLRIPIRSDLLARLLGYVETHVKPYYVSVLYCTAFSLAYHMCLRVSEYTVCKNTDHTILMSDIFRINLPNNDNGYRIKFRSFKHCP